MTYTLYVTFGRDYWMKSFTHLSAKLAFVTYKAFVDSCLARGYDATIALIPDFDRSKH